MDDEIGKDVAIEAVGAGGVEGAVAQAAGGVDCREGLEVEVCGDDHVEGGEVFGLAEADGFDVYKERYAGVELADLRRCCLSSLG